MSRGRRRRGGPRRAAGDGSSAAAPGAEAGPKPQAGPRKGGPRQKQAPQGGQQQGAPPPGALAGPAVTGLQVAQEAKKRTPLDPPAIHMSPPATQDLLVQLATWLWSDTTTWHVTHATASIDGISATTTATPVDLAWDMGDSQPGSKFTCLGPGTPYDPAQPNATSEPLSRMNFEQTLWSARWTQFW